MAAASRAPAAAAGAVGAVSAANIIDPLVGATAAATLNSVFQLKHGCKAAVTIPAFGLGVYQAPQGDPCVIAVEAAIKAGVRHFDTARIYGNESSVGAAIRKSGLRREEVFVTTKVRPRKDGAAGAEARGLALPSERVCAGVEAERRD
jgi:aryl-alcohol dehydrogenase-like predicted oxidoreductase